MKKASRCLLPFFIVSLLSWVPLGGHVVLAEPKDMMDNLIPGEEEMGIIPGETTLDYRVYPTDHYTWDLGYDLVEWDRWWKPKLNNPFPILLNGLANGLFLGNAFVVRLSIFLMQLGFHTDLVNQQISIIVPIMDGLRISLFQKFLPFALVILAAWAVKVGYWNNQTTRLTSGLIGAIVIMIAGFWFMSNIGYSVSYISKTMDKLTLVTMGSLAAPYQAVTGDKVESEGILSAADQQLLNTSNRVWKLFVDRPWMIGEFNREEASEVTITREERQKILELARENEIKVPVREGDPWSHWMRKYSAGMPQRDILRTVLGSPTLDHGDHPDLPSLFWGGSAGIRCLIALLSLVASLTLLLFVGTVSMILVIAQEMALAIVMIAPIVFLLGIFPERGFAFTRRWFIWFIGVLGTKVVYGFYLGFTLLVADIVARGSGILMIQQIFVALLFFCAFLFRKRILQNILSIFQTPTPQDIYTTTKAEVSQHWNETKDSWNQAKERAKRLIPKKKK